MRSGSLSIGFNVDATMVDSAHLLIGLEEPEKSMMYRDAQTIGSSLANSSSYGVEWMDM